MDITFLELQKRDVVNVNDGKCLGSITDITLKFPEGILMGITVPGRKTNCITKFFVKNETYIDRRKIVKIGNDVILVDLRCDDFNANNTCVQRGKDPCKHKKTPCEELFSSRPNNEYEINRDDY